MASFLIRYLRNKCYLMYCGLSIDYLNYISFEFNSVAIEIHSPKVWRRERLQVECPRLSSRNYNMA